MKFSYLRPAITHAFSRQKKSLTAVIHDNKDAAMAAYLLEHHTGEYKAEDLGLGLVWLTELAGTGHKAWLEAARLLRQHPEAAKISETVIESCMISCARHANVALMEELVLFPQIKNFTSRAWDGVLFDCLPKGDPEKKRIEQRHFEDKDGDPRILEIVRRTMARAKTTAAASTARIDSF